MNTIIDIYRPVFLFGMKFFHHQKQWKFQDLRNQAMSVINVAREQVKALNLTQKQEQAALLAVVIWFDEKVLCSSWKEATFWQNNLLQYHYFEMGLGGEEFFTQLSQLEHNDHEIKQLYLYCLLLGFKGKYSQRSGDKLENIIQQLKKITLPARWQTWPDTSPLLPFADFKPTKKPALWLRLLQHKVILVITIVICVYVIELITLFMTGLHHV